VHVRSARIESFEHKHINQLYNRCFVRKVDEVVERYFPFEITPSTFFIVVHDNGIGFGPAVDQPSRLTSRILGDVRRIGPRKMARQILQDETFQRARREHGDDLVWVLLACISVPHMAEFADTLGVPGWMADSEMTLIGPAVLGNWITLRARRGEPEPRWHYVRPTQLRGAQTIVDQRTGVQNQPHGGEGATDDLDEVASSLRCADVDSIDEPVADQVGDAAATGILDELPAAATTALQQGIGEQRGLTQVPPGLSDSNTRTAGVAEAPTRHGSEQGLARVEATPEPSTAAASTATSPADDALSPPSSRQPTNGEGGQEYPPGQFTGGHSLSSEDPAQGWEQVSDALEIRLKDMNNWRQARARRRGHGHFFDTNANPTFIVDSPAGGPGFALASTEGFAGLATVLWSEHAESRQVGSAAVAERTVKSTSYVAYKFRFAATPRVRIVGPRRAWPLRAVSRPEWTNAGTLPEPVAGAVDVVAARESLRPLNAAAVAASPAVHVRQGQHPVSRVPADTPVRLPLDSWVEAFAGARAVREAVERLVADRAAPGTPEYRRLIAGVSVRAVKAAVHEASQLGYEIVFGGVDGTAPVSVTAKIELTNPLVVVATDPKTWADSDYRSVLSTSVATTAEDVFDIPPGLLLFGVNLTFLRDYATPWLFFWPEIDAEMTRSGPGAETTELSGTRLVGEPTAVTRFDATVRLTRSDRPGDTPAVLALPGSMWIRALRRDTRELWADLPDLPGEQPPGDAGPLLRAPANMDRRWPPMFRLTDLTGAEGLFDTAMAMLRRDFAGIVPNAEGSGARLAVENERTLRDMLAVDKIAARMGQLLSPNGYPRRLTRATVAGRFGEEVVVRLKARLGALPAGAVDPSAVVYQEPAFRDYLPDVEMDFNITSAQDLVLSSAKIWSLWYGLQATVGITEAGRGPLAALEPRPMLHRRKQLAAVLTNGVATWGMHGAAIDGAGRFDGGMVLFFSIENAARGAAAGEGPALGSDLVAGGDQTLMEPAVELTTSPPGTAGPAGALVEHRPVPVPPVDPPPVAPPVAPPPVVLPVDPPPVAPPVDVLPVDAPPVDAVGVDAVPVDALAAKPALPRVVRADPVRVDYRVMMPAAVTSKRQSGADGRPRWVPFSTPDPGDQSTSDSATSTTGRAAAGPPTFVPSRQRPFPRETLLMIGHNGLVKQAVEAFEEMGFGSLPATSRIELETAAFSAAHEVNNYLDPGMRKTRQIWSGPIAARTTWQDKATGLVTGWRAFGSVEVAFDVEWVKTVDVADSFGPYYDVGAAVLQNLGLDDTDGWFAGLRLRFPLDFGRELPVESAEPESSGIRQFQISAQPQAAYRRQMTDSTASEVAGSQGRFGLDIGAMAVTVARVNYRLRVRSWNARTLRPHTGEQERGLDGTVSGVAVFPAVEATRLGLMPSGREVYLDLSRRYKFPEHAREHIGSATVHRAPDIGGFTANLVQLLRDPFG